MMCLFYLNVYPLTPIKRLFYQLDAKHLTISAMLEVRDSVEERHNPLQKIIVEKKKIHLLTFIQQKSH